MCISFILLAGGAAFNISVDEGSESRPPELSSNELMGFKETGMVGRFMVMAPLEDGAAEGVISGDVDTVFIGEDTGLDFPVSKAGVEGQGNVFMHGLKCLEDEWVTGGGRFDALGEGGVDEVDEE